MISSSERYEDAQRRRINPHRVMLENLFLEFIQSERSAEIHPRREASRLGDSAPARALGSVTQHALSVRDELQAIARSRGIRAAAVRKIGDLFSVARQWFADAVMEEERSYRATLLGMRHGLDLVKLIRAAAESADDVSLAAWCTEWLGVREPLVEEVCNQLAWFGWHPEAAIQHRRGPRLALRRLVLSLRSGSTEEALGV
jgi:hypothetical protein